MSLTSFRNRLNHWFEAPVEVDLVCEIAADHVAAARYQNGRIESWALRKLPAGVVRPAPLGDNVADAAAVQEALKEVLEPVANGRRRCVLLVPDLVARIALLELDQLPAGVEEADGLLRWRLKKDLPFDVGQAVLAYRARPGRTTKHEVMVVVCLRSLLRQYESCVEKLGLHAGWVTLSTLSALDCLPSSSSAPRLLVKRDHNSLSLVILHGEAVRLFRSLPVAARGSGPVGSELFEKIYPAAIYFQDQWGQSVAEAALTGLHSGRSKLVEQLRGELGCVAQDMDVAAYGLPPSAVTSAGADYRLLPAVGWALGEGI
jgi:type IV pilus assembly protein PilM